MLLKSLDICPELFDYNLLEFSSEHVPTLIRIMNLVQLVIVLQKV